MRKGSFDLHDTVTKKIVAAIEAGVDDWHMPWHRPGLDFSIPKNALTNQFYRGINILSLWIDADEKKFEHQIWATYKQWKELGAQVRGGEKASIIVKYGEWTPKDNSAGDGGNGEENDKESGSRKYARASWVFNVAQVDGFAVTPKIPRPDLTVRLEHVDRFIANTKAEFRYGGGRAFYRHPPADFIQIPERSSFTGSATSSATEAFEATRLHELNHWAGAKPRLDRELGKRFGDEAYAMEEMIVEIAAAGLCCMLEITNEPRPDHAQYVKHWLTVLKADDRAIFTAAAAASRSIDYLMTLQPKTEATTEEPA